MKQQKISELGMIQFIILFLVVAGLIVGLYLLKNKQIFSSHASNEPIVFQSSGGADLPKDPAKKNLPVTTSNNIQVQLNVPPPQ